jgi:hypothetical protein
MALWNWATVFEGKSSSAERPPVDFHPELSRAFHLEVSHF